MHQFFKKTLKFPFLSIALFLFVTSIYNEAVAQDLPGTRDSLYSEILQEQRILQIILPKNYKPESNDKYDVLYLLDGEWHTNIASQIEPYVKDNGFKPSSIIVGVINVDRNRDLLPTKGESLPTSGGADKFLSFLKDELIPYINKTYPSNDTKTLFGASFGGIFSMYAFLQDPELFDSYIAGDPAFWWDNNYMTKLAAKNLENIKASNKSIFVGGREGGAYKGMGIDVMDSVFQAKAPADLHWKFIAYPNETHSSVNFKTMYDGLKFSYSGYNSKVRYHPMNGIVVKGMPLKIWNFTEDADLYYTLDGTEPKASSPKMERELILESPAKLSIRLAAQLKKYDKLVMGDFKEGSVLTATKKPNKSKAGGFKYSYYEGEWDSIPNFANLKLVQSGLTDENFKLDKFPRRNNFALLIEGLLEIKEDGYYIFGLESGIGSKLFLGNQLLIHYDNPKADEAKTFVVPLEKGFYPVKFEHFQKEEEGRFSLVYVTPGATDLKPIPLEDQYSLR